MKNLSSIAEVAALALIVAGVLLLFGLAVALIVAGILLLAFVIAIDLLAMPRRRRPE